MGPGEVVGVAWGGGAQGGGPGRWGPGEVGPGEVGPGEVGRRGGPGRWPRDVGEGGGLGSPKDSWQAVWQCRSCGPAWRWPSWPPGGWATFPPTNTATADHWGQQLQPFRGGQDESDPSPVSG